jgi:hypothetical protein
VVFLMPTAKAEGTSKEVYLNDALPVGANQIGSMVQDRDALAAVTLKASGEESADTTGVDVADANLEKASALLLLLNVTAQSGTGPTLDVAVQAKIGGLYYNLARFAQRGATTTKTALIVKRNPALVSELTLEADPAVGSGLLNNDGAQWIDTLRYKSDLGGTTPSYTYSVTVYPIK